VYAALGGVLFLLAVFLQGSLGFTPLEAGAATLPVTALMLLLSARSGALAQRIGPRLPLTAGPLLLTAAMLLMTRIDPGDGYVGSVLPALLVFGLGLAALVAPVTATVLAAADERHSGVASGINNAVARIAQLLAVAVLPLVAGLSGADYERPHALAEGFHAAMRVGAALAVLGAVVAYAGIRTDVLERRPQPSGEQHAPGERGDAARLAEVGAVARPTHCAVAGPPALDVRSPARRAA
jgi:MFS family permease